MSTLVAIIVGCRNQEQWIKQALYSAQNQIVPHYAKGGYLPSFQVIEHHDGCGGEGTSASASRNRAITQADAEWIIWLDADDLIPSNFLYEMWARKLPFPDSRFSDIVTPYQQFITGCRLDVFHQLELINSTGVRSVSTLGNTLISLSYPTVITSMFSKEAWKAVNGFDEALGPLEDLDFWIRMRMLQGELMIANRTHLLRRQIKPVPMSEFRTLGQRIAYGAKREKAKDHFRTQYGIDLGDSLLPYEIPSTDIV